MPITYRVDREKWLIFESWVGVVGADDLAAYWTQYLTDADVLKIRRTIVDLRGAIITFNGDDLRFLVDSLVRPKLSNLKWKTAIVVTGGSVEFGVSRQYQVFAGHYSTDSIFENLEDADNWICS